MKKIVIQSILAVLLVFGLVNSPALAATTQQPMSVISINLPVYESFAKLSDPYNHDHVAELSYNDKVTILSEQDYAAQIQFQQSGVTKTGWVHRAYLSDSIMNQTWLVKSWRNLHTEPNSTSPLVAGHEKVEDQSLVYVLAYNKDVNYYQIQLADGTTGWIKGSYLSEDGYDYKAGRNVIPYEFGKAGTVTTTLSIYTPLNTTANVTADQLNKYIDYKTNGTKTLMTGMGPYYLQAQDKSGLNVIYLLAHSGLESKWGASAIVSNKYNFYGINAVDLQPAEGAYNYSSPANGIVAGSIFINRTYVNRNQSNLDYPFAQPTLDNMRFNDNLHQYSTDEAWAGKISGLIKEFNVFTYTKGWKKIAGNWYYNIGNGTYKTGWLLDGGKWYYMNSSGLMQTGWVKDGSSWYYLAASGAMQTGWLKYNSEWYYLDTNGKMVTGWKKVSGKWYYFYSSGKMAHDTKIGGYRLSHSGAMI